MAEYTAVFPLVARARDFERRLHDKGMWAKNVERKGRTVTFDDDVPATYKSFVTVWSPELRQYVTEEEEFEAHATKEELFLDRLELVGYWGSDERRKATLNGVRAPMAY